MKNTRKGVFRDLSDLLHQLIDTYKSMIGIIQNINQITGKTKVLSLNSSIEAARAGVAGRGFAVIAKEMQKFSDLSKSANDEGLLTINSLNKRINDVVGVRTADVAFDLIDKIDRNLFERNCDVQAWATFDRIVDYAMEPSEKRKQQVTLLLNNLYRIYEVYYDIIMTNVDGEIIATGVNQSIIGKNVSSSEWFRNTIESKKATVSDMYYSKNQNGYTVAYSCPIVNLNGDIIGVLSTRFNWNYIYDIIDKAKLSHNSEVYVINQHGIVIASKVQEEVLKKNLNEVYNIVGEVINGEDYGYEIEEDDNKLISVIGYAHTKGYNSYEGKKWSVIVRELF